VRERRLHLVVPGSLSQLTGGSIYDARMAAGLQQRGWTIVVHEVATATAAVADGRPTLAATLPRIPDAVPVVIDGLALRGSPEVIRGHAGRLTLVALVHLLAADDPAVEPPLRTRLQDLEEKALAACAGVIATSRATADRLAATAIEPERVRTVPPGTDPAPAASGPAPGQPPQLLCVAAVTPGKGHEVLVRALDRLRGAAWTCICAGSLTRSPAYARSVRAIIEGAGSSERIMFAGECDAATLERLYASSSVFVLPSDHESYGMALAEAMAHGLPIVSTRAGAIPDIVPTDVGILVPPGDDVALAGALHRLLVDAPGEPGSAWSRRTTLGGAARRHAASLPTWEQAVDGFAAAVSRLSGTFARSESACDDADAAAT
jgi:glycosyltransferase involved in cell wall biosynthesis